MRINELLETAAGTTSSNIAVVVNPAVARGKGKPKMQKPTDNALDMDANLFSGGAIKRNTSKPLGAL